MTSCSKCRERHTAGFMLAVEPPVCVFCHYGIESSESKGRCRTRAEDRADAEAQARRYADVSVLDGEGRRLRGSGRSATQPCESLFQEDARCRVMPARRASNLLSPSLIYFALARSIKLVHEGG